MADVQDPQQDAIARRLDALKGVLGVDPGQAMTPLDVISAGGRAIDSVTGAPTRAAISAAQEGKNPLSAFGEHFGANPDAAPTGEDIVGKTNLLDRKGLAAKIAGMGVDIAADPTNLIPGKALAGGGLLMMGKLGKVARAAEDVEKPLALGVLEARRYRAAGAAPKGALENKRYLETQRAFLKDYADPERLDRATKGIEGALASIDERISVSPPDVAERLADRKNELLEERKKFTPEAIRDAQNQLEEINAKLGSYYRQSQ